MAAGTQGSIWTGGSRSAFGWALYDWANSPFTTVVTTFIFAAYFAEATEADKIAGASQWAFMQGAAAIAVAILSPVLGAIADRGRSRKAWIVFWTLTMVTASTKYFYKTIFYRSSTPRRTTIVQALKWHSLRVRAVFFERFFETGLPGDRLRRAVRRPASLPWPATTATASRRHTGEATSLSGAGN